MAIFDDDQRRDRPQPPSALRVATGRADGFVAPPSNTQGYGFVVASRPRRRRARHKRERNYEMGYLVKRCLLLFISLAIGIGSLEILLRLVNPLSDPYAAVKESGFFIRSQHLPHRDLLIRAEPGLHGLEGQSRWTTNNFGFRGHRSYPRRRHPRLDGSELALPKPLGEYRIFIIGGSSAECMMLDDHDSLDAVLQRKLRRHKRGSNVRVYNAG